jgi:hypothetical protein
MGHILEDYPLLEAILDATSLPFQASETLQYLSKQSTVSIGGIIINAKEI